MFYCICYNNIIFLSKTLKIKKSNSTTHDLVTANANRFFHCFFLITFLTLKMDNSTSTLIIVILSIFLLKLSGIVENFTPQSINLNATQFILPLFTGLTYTLYFVSSYLTLFFFIEVYGVLYYFCFLTSYSFTNQTILKYKNGLLMLLWNNFLTTFFLALGSFLITRESGTSSFAELSLLISSDAYTYIFLLGLSWKLGLPIFHFFKLEVYKYLLRENVFMFSMLTTIINLIILFFCLNQTVIYTALYSHNYVVFTVIFGAILILGNLKLNSILQFFALSGALTMATLLTVYLI